MLRALWRLFFVNLIGNLLRSLSYLLRLPRRRPRWVKIDIDERLVARPAKRRMFQARVPSLGRLARDATELAADRRLEGVVVRIESVPGGWATLQALRDVLSRLRAADKRVVAHLSGASLRDYYVASAADSILADESASLRLLGIAAEVTFFTGALEHLGISAELEAGGRYKSFAEPFTRRDMSPAHREALEAILDRTDAELKGAVAASRNVPAERAGELLAGGPYTAAEAKEAGLIDGVCYADEIPTWLGDSRPEPHTVGAWRRARRRPRWKPLRRRRVVRVLSLHGALVPGEGTSFPRRTLGAKAACRSLRAARRDRRTAACVLHVDCRGGSADGSDRVWREVLLLGREKPVVACFADVAASGGYYLACAASRIVAQPLTLTGSIGVVAGKLSLAGLYERAGLSTVLLSRGEAAGMDRPSRGYSEEERRRLRREVEAIYEQFVRRVAEGRKLSFQDADAAAQGRVWTGLDASERGLVDELGDAEHAIELARSLGRRRPGEALEVIDVVPEPKRRDLLSRAFAAGPLDPPAGPLGELLDLAHLSRERVWALPTFGFFWRD